MRTKIVIGVVAVVLLAGCATGPERADTKESDVYFGAGRGETLGRAIAEAKMDAVRRAVIDLIGQEAESAQAEHLEEVLYSSENPNAYVYNETMERLRRDGSLIEGELVYEIRIRVNVEAVRRTLAANGIGSDIPRAAATTETIPEPAYDEVTDDERGFIARYVDTMTYMVYFSDRAASGLRNSDFAMRSAVNQANSYLVSNGHLVIDADQVEELKEDQRLVYEEQVGQELSLLQWVARRLNADVYIELDALVSSRARGDSHYATADVTLNMYETSTGQILGSINRRSQETFSRTSEEDAAINALQSTVYQAMPFAVDTARSQMERSLTRGIRYELTLQRPPDGQTRSRFRRAMADRVRQIATVSQSPNEVLYEVFLIGSTDDLVDLVFEVSERVAGFENTSLVISRGRSLTFDAGF